MTTALRVRPIRWDICDRLLEKGAFGAENKNVVFNLF